MISEETNIFRRPIYSELDDKPDKEVTIELSCTLVEGMKEPVTYKPADYNRVSMQSTNSFNRLIHDFKLIGELMNNFSDRFYDGIARLTYQGKTYDMRKMSDVEELRNTAIHFIGFPDL